MVKIKPKLYEDKYYSCKCGNVLMFKYKKYNTILNTIDDALPRCLSCGREIDWSDLK